ncbi:hypothetical protein F4801DRAFT_158658 [Xylaria longipes]|nr:hypothetical protein F4801DRAFT_158658 [Xylaria longipes]RYC62891.1 hypothetical protein CHU98_g3330 [Xylaria longipes]
MSSLRETTITLGRNDDSHEPSDEEYKLERVYDDKLHDANYSQPSDRLIIAVDFATTYSCVSYVAVKEDEIPQILGLDRIHSIENFPNDWNSNPTDPMKAQVPTEVVYKLKSSPMALWQKRAKTN